MGHLSTSERIDASKVVMSGDSKVADMVIDGGSDKSRTISDDHESADQNNNVEKMNDEVIVESSMVEPVVSNGSVVNGNVCNGVKPANKSMLNVAEVDVAKKNDDTPEQDGPTVFGVKFRAPLKWDKIILISVFHMIFLYGALSYSLWNNKWLTTLWALFMGGCAGFGVTGGVHRLWSHKSYKAKLPLRIILMICFSIAGQNTIYDWVRDHRVHHKFSETDADPHNSHRGFFFAHVGWLMMHKHPQVLKRGRQLDMTDITSDPVVQFHTKYFVPMKILLCFILPTLVPVYCWNECWYWSIMTQVVLRYVFSLNFTWSVNSAAHMWGNRPYDSRIKPSENIGVSIFAMGEGWHNYHHVFPWDYKAAELGNYTFNITTFWIDQFAKIGWAYDLKQPSKELVKRTIERHGDGSHPVFHPHNEVPPPDETISDNCDLNSNHIKAS